MAAARPLNLPPYSAPEQVVTQSPRVQHGASSPGALALLSGSVYLLIVAYLYHSILGVTRGHFIYALDDPYIHLALAEQLAHGHYGINAVEFSSPSSSILWPFLLLFGAGKPFHAYVPLAWNLLFGLIAACLLGWQVGRWPPQTDEQGRAAWWKQGLIVVLLVFVANLPSLTVLGMEHVLQVLLSIACAIGMIEALDDRRIPAWCLLAAVIAPCVRYEDLTLTLAISCALVGLGQRAKACIVFGLSLVPLAIFSVYLKRHGLPLLPMSVLVKGNAYTHGNLPAKLIFQLKDALHKGFIEPERYPVIVLFFLFAGLAWHAKVKVQRWVFSGAAALGFLQLLVGRFGWFYRYEVYAVIFLTLMTLRVIAARPRFSFGYFLLGLVFCASPFIKATADTSTAAREIFQQQYQMHRFVTAFYTGSYAVNDLGWTSFQRRPGTYVLDIYGLASAEASSHTDKRADWLTSIVTRYDVPLAMVYPEWFHIPPSWHPIMKMCLPVPPILLTHQCVTFYSTSPEHEEEIRADLQRFASTLPKDIPFHLAQPGQSESLWEPSEGILH